MSAHAPLPDDARALLLALLADPLACYRVPTARLEQVLALTPGAMHGRRAPDPVLACLEAARAAICAVLEARRRLDARERQQAAARATEAAALPGGAKVPTGPQRPGPLPPARLDPRAEAQALALSRDAL